MDGDSPQPTQRWQHSHNGTEQLAHSTIGWIRLSPQFRHRPHAEQAGSATSTIHSHPGQRIKFNLTLVVESLVAMSLSRFGFTPTRRQVCSIKQWAVRTPVVADARVLNSLLRTFV